MARTAGGRWTAWTVGTLVLAMLAAWIWWRESETATRWRLEEAMETFCGGVLAHERSSLFEGLWHGMELKNDSALGPDAHYCMMGEQRTEVTVALLRAGEYENRDLEEILPPFSGRLLPVPLTGHWRGAADGGSVRVLVNCQDSQNLVSVTVGSYLTVTASEEKEARQEGQSKWLDDDLYWARFATATAVKASDHWGCKAEVGQPLRALPAVTEPEPTTGADGTCAGLPFARDQRLDILSETTTSSSALYEICQVGASHYFDDRYAFFARFGPYAVRDRDWATRRDTQAEAGADGSTLWASARCPGDTERALFTGYVPPAAATVWLPGEKGKESFGLPAFREFAERSAKRHSCTDLRLPQG